MEERIFFEIQTAKDGRWTTVELRETESMALALARAELAKPQCAGARVVRNRRRADGTTDETVLFTENREVAPAPVDIVPIPDAHLCTDSHDFYGLQSRLTINRLLRKYIDVAFITPTEMLHNYRAVQKIQAFGSLFTAGVDRVASLQGAMPGQTYKSRRDTLYEITDQIARRAKKVAEHPRLPNLKGADLGPVLQSVEGLGKPGREPYYATVVLADALIAERSWLGKFDRLAQIAAGTDRPDVLDIVDGVAADLMGIASAFQDIMGFQRNLAQTLLTMTDLCDGTFDAEKSDARDQLAVIGPMIARGAMPQTREALLDRLRRLLEGSQPLDRHDPSGEADAFRAVATRLKRPGGGVLGGEPVNQALNKRAQRLFGSIAIPAAPPPEKAAANRPASRATFLAGLAAGAANTQEFQPGSLIFRAGDPGDRAFMLLSGSVEITTIHKGRRTLLARLEEGSIFGELSLFLSVPRTADAVTVTGCRLRVIDSSEMQGRVDALDPFCRHWVSYLIGRITDLTGKLNDMGTGERQ